VNSSNSKGFSVSDVKLALANKNDLKLLAAFSKRMRRNDIKILPVDETEIFEKYRARDNTSKLNIFIVKYKNCIIGCTAYSPFSGLLNKKNISGILANTTIIDPARSNLFPTVSVLLGRSYKELVFEKKLFTLFFPLNDTISSAFEKRPFKHFAHLYQFTNPFIGKIKPTIKSSTMQIKKIDYFDKKVINKFFKKISSQYYFLMHADADFLNWKYVSNPYRKFTILAAVIQSEFIGYIVVEKIGTDIYIVDMVVNLDYPSAILFLMFKSFGYFDTNNITNTIFCVAHQRYVSILKKAGFFCSWQRECFFYPGALAFYGISESNFYASKKETYHFNGFARHLY
jgi:hypothetical protein